MFFRRLLLYITIISLCTFAGSCPALCSQEDKGVDEILKRLENKFEHINSMKVYFCQIVSRKGIKEPLRARGNAWFKRPHSMRWEYEAPEKQLIIVSEERVFLWEKGPNQVMVYDRKQFVPGELGDIFFPKASLIEKNFLVRVKGDGEETITLELTPRGELGGVQKVLVQFQKANMMIKALQFMDSLGTKTVINFEKVVVNPELPEKLFLFRAPKGAKIYYQN